MRMFRVYRLTPPEEYRRLGLANGRNKPDMCGCLFDDGRVAVRWQTDQKSSVWWDSWDDLYRVHIVPHQQYGTTVVWSPVFSESEHIQYH